MVNTSTDADLSAAVQNALQTLLPQIHGFGDCLRVSRCISRRTSRDTSGSRGHIVSAEGITMDPAKVEAITKRPRPMFVTEVPSSPWVPLRATPTRFSLRVDADTQESVVELLVPASSVVRLAICRRIARRTPMRVHLVRLIRSQ
nr:putative reverse transcriptase domain-containing protein [Tanacetum cinerariifolium]